MTAKERARYYLRRFAERFTRGQYLLWWSQIRGCTLPRGRVSACKLRFAFWARNVFNQTGRNATAKERARFLLRV